MSDNPLDTNFKKKSEFLIGIDSDGCAFDSMEIKHKECFIPNFINYFGLQPISKYAREAAEFTNLYSKWRGANRFISYTLALDLLEERPEVLSRNVKIPKLQGVRDWIQRETKLGNPTLTAEVEKTKDPDLELALKWSLAVNDMIADMVHDVPPYPNVRESLIKLDPVADMIVCSATPNEALNKEWEEHDIAQYVDAICGQEAGSKKETLGQAKACGYDSDKVLMIGDAPGDMKAAEAVGALFYPINPGAEEASWERFIGEACDKFLNGEFAGEYQQKIIAEFDSYLPELPPWKR
ncbi:HAD family hydrolase [Gimesia algae]|uniref:phosphoglycolate phosphatase n=1 Tax=Gimesia algae TaxID=2527971 RepID=A0A517V979_9PLAN|nr:HAD hydrolase-like protein [Gimesia algae]QDT89542.1 Phosphoglycolate phosphatase [Gimesia algae]